MQSLQYFPQLLAEFHSVNEVGLILYPGPEQSMKIDDRKINRSIDDNRLITVD